ncbi:MAG: transcriptional regulator [Balneolaceae bacterium]|nr:transcriptional regulator [Balneolaceae bacterium]
MISVITGDIINSRSTEAEEWLSVLKEVLNQIGESPEVWEIFRGDSFQVEVKNPEDALLRAIQIKAAIKQIKSIDVRMCIGIGEKSYSAKRITESNGEAFIHSGEGFEKLKSSKQTLSIVSPIVALDADMNLYLRLILIVMDNWTSRTAEFVYISLGEDLLQEEIAGMLDISQSSVSERRQRSHIAEIMEVETHYRDKLRAYKLTK